LNRLSPGTPLAGGPARGTHRIPVVIKSAPEMERFQMALIENLQREDLNALNRRKALCGWSMNFN